MKLLPLAVVLASSTAALAEPYVPPAGLGTPGRRESAGTRGCILAGAPTELIGLIPTENIGLSATPYPRFYWYMPISQAQSFRFSLFQVDESGAPLSILYTTRLDVPQDETGLGRAGIVSFEVPETANQPGLEPGDRYLWQIEAFCNPANETGDLQISGWVEYRPPSQGLSSVLPLVSASDQVSLYTQNGFWFDAVAQLATLQTAADGSDRSWAARWSELLESVDLSQLDDQPLLSN
ncbi:DUF928 domain-containing protein [Leptolyngbya iicbica]|uniref:DUF928 domain-containing protein n=1 Tax=Lyngbya confervoides BDU141951 TaxID=1574623 RepID=A0A8T6QQT9_9CYAN|nr:DUF928 domain-containing protein [Leptolyngbya sp. LK]